MLALQALFLSFQNNEGSFGELGRLGGGPVAGKAMVGRGGEPHEETLHQRRGWEETGLMKESADSRHSVQLTGDSILTLTQMARLGGRVTRLRV